MENDPEVRNGDPPHYFNSNNSMQVGDRVSVDGWPAVVELIIPARSQAACDFDCFETGGVLLQTEHYGRMLIPHGDSSEWMLVEAASQ
jgi:hypothetical protein